MVPTANVLQRTFQFAFDGSSGTCFTVDHNKRQYIVTAKHIVEDITSSATIKIRHDESWKDCQVNLVGHCGEIVDIVEEAVDISVLAADFQLSPTLPLPTNPDKISLGQDVYFLGFPYGLNTKVGKLNRDFPIPFIKKAILSATYGKFDLMFLDGHNNPGFSGGPVILSQTNNQSNSFSVAGVISGYKREMRPVFLAGERTNLKFKYNTGIIFAYGIDHAIHLINQNPIGFNLKNEQSA